MPRDRDDVFLPLLTPWLSSLWLTLVTDIDIGTGQALIDSMTNEVTVRDHSIRELIPIQPMSYDDAVRAAGDTASRRIDPRTVDDPGCGDALGRLAEPIKPLVENSIAAMALVELHVLTGDPDAPFLERARRALESVAALPRQYGLIAAVFARALDRTHHAVKVTTRNTELARAATLAHPYAVIDPDGDQRAVASLL